MLQEIIAGQVFFLSHLLEKKTLPLQKWVDELLYMGDMAQSRPGIKPVELVDVIGDREVYRQCQG